MRAANRSLSRRVCRRARVRGRHRDSRGPADTWVGRQRRRRRSHDSAQRMRKLSLPNCTYSMSSAPAPHMISNRNLGASYAELHVTRHSRLTGRCSKGCPVTRSGVEKMALLAQGQVLGHERDDAGAAAPLRRARLARVRHRRRGARCRASWRLIEDTSAGRSRALQPDGDDQTPCSKQQASSGAAYPAPRARVLHGLSPFAMERVRNAIPQMPAARPVGQGSLWAPDSGTGGAVPPQARPVHRSSRRRPATRQRLRIAHVVTRPPHECAAAPLAIKRNRLLADG